MGILRQAAKAAFVFPYGLFFTPFIDFNHLANPGGLARGVVFTGGLARASGNFVSRGPMGTTITGGFLFCGDGNFSALALVRAMLFFI